uniref:Myb/SANT-like DNA-binding domain-containing protein n=1 Tax=Amphimedon queenslandica TaxID=400682 RepID=A0A1X7V8M3_AMPQE
MDCEDEEYNLALLYDDPMNSQPNDNPSNHHDHSGPPRGRGGRRPPPRPPTPRPRPHDRDEERDVVSDGGGRGRGTAGRGRGAAGQGAVPRGRGTAGSGGRGDGSPGPRRPDVRALIDIWGDADVQQQLDSVSRNRHIYEKISTDLNNLGYHKTGKQCKTKVKNLTQRFRKLRDGHCFTGTRLEWHLYDNIDAILGTRASSDPPFVLDSGALEASIITDITEPEVSLFEEHNDSGNSRSMSVENITQETSTEQDTNSCPEKLHLMKPLLW